MSKFKIDSFDSIEAVLRKVEAEINKIYERLEMMDAMPAPDEVTFLDGCMCDAEYTGAHRPECVLKKLRRK